jgi:hypothetical protein
LVAQRVVRPVDQATGINAYCYLHPGQRWLGKPPSDLGRGKLDHWLVEVAPPSGNRIRSHLEITAPDGTSNQEIVEVVTNGSELLHARGDPLPWHLRHGETTLVFNLELGLANHWQLELRILLGYALQVRRPPAS